MNLRHWNSPSLSLKADDQRHSSLNEVIMTYQERYIKNSSINLFVHEIIKGVTLMWHLKLEVITHMNLNSLSCNRTFLQDNSMSNLPFSTKIKQNIPIPCFVSVFARSTMMLPLHKQVLNFIYIHVIKKLLLWQFTPQHLAQQHETYRPLC
jgi:hypothetical protein